MFHTRIDISATCYCLRHVIKSLLLAAFAKLWQAAISSVMFVSMEQRGSRWTDFHEIWYFRIRKYVYVDKIFKFG